MFRREIHRAMEPILRAIDPRALEEHGFALGGATRIALAFGEVRESADLDFVGSDAQGFASLRAAMRDRGYAALLLDPETLELPREPTSDQYGVRFPVRVDGRTIKVELIHEGRITLGAPSREAFTALPCLSIRDCWAEKLLASSDRGADASQLDRDLIDLAILREKVGPVPEDAWALARGAYGASVETDLGKAIARFLTDAERRARSFAGLRVDDPALIERGVAHLAGDLAKR